MSRDWAGGSTRRWRAIRSSVLLRDQFRCQLQLTGCTTRATHVHHLDGKAMGDDPTRLVAACEHCNLVTGQPQGDPPPTPRTHW